jgi:hypothetical protein
MDTTVYSLAVSGTNIFAGTWNCGIFLSTNNGISWTAVNNGLMGISINALAVSPNGTADTNIFAGTGTGGIFLSTNNGTSWTAVNNGLPTNYWVSSIAIFSNGIWGTNLLAGTSIGPYISTNNGSTWTEANECFVGTGEYALAASGSNLFAGTRAGIFLSTDNGTKWSAVNNGLVSYSVIYVNALAVSGSNLFAGIISLTTGVFLSTNNGTNWSAVNNGLPQSQVQSLAISPVGTGGTNIFAGTIGHGIFLSTNTGQSWNAINTGLTNTDIFSLAVSTDGKGGTITFAGTWGGGVFLSTNNGTNWIAVNNGLPANAYVSALGICGTNIFGIIGGHVFHSTDKGTSWTDVSNGLSDASAMSIAVSGTNIFVGTGNSGVFLSTNNGTSWKNISTGLPANYIVNSLTISNTHIYTGTLGGCVWRRPLSEIINSVWQAGINVKDNGNISQSLTFGQSLAATDSIDSELGEVPLPPPPFGFDVRFHLPTGDESWIDYRSSNLDTIEWLIKFQPGSGGYPITFSWDTKNLPIGSLYLKDIITGSIVNINMKTDSSFTLTNTGINELSINYIAPAVNPTAITVVKSLPTVFSLSQNYPNPFNPSTVIRYGLPGASNVKIKIYNLLGQEVESLVNETQSAGYHEITWNASNKASGIYLYSIDATPTDGKGNFRSAKKLILIK